MWDDYPYERTEDDFDCPMCGHLVHMATWANGKHRYLCTGCGTQSADCKRPAAAKASYMRMASLYFNYLAQAPDPEAATAQQIGPRQETTPGAYALQARARHKMLADVARQGQPFPKWKGLTPGPGQVKMPL